MLYSVSNKVKSARAVAGRFAQDAKGTVGTTFGLMAIIMCIMIGGAVDLGRWLNARDQTIAAIDASVLAAAHALQTGSTVSEATALADRFYVANTKGRILVDQDTVRFKVSSDKTTVTATGSARIRAPFLGLVDAGGTALDFLPLFKETEAPEASTRQSDEVVGNREIALMLDVSGSMCQPCTKRDDMKAAARDLVNIVISDSPRDYWTKVAIVPFSGDVRPPASIYEQVTNPAANNRLSVPVSGGGNNNSGPGNNNDDDDGETYKKTACVAERTGPNKHNDAEPNENNGFVMHTYSASGNCSTQAASEVLPLSNSKSAVIARINGLVTGGGTAGHIGTAWSYYMLSPNWGPVLPGESRPAAYGTEKLTKTAILMTDGEYNRTYDRNGIVVGDQYAGPSANGNSSAAQAIALCNQMKQDGIEVYTVGFDLDDQKAINTLKNCASDPEKAYLASNGEALKQVFRDIAVKLTDLHLLR